MTSYQYDTAMLFKEVINRHNLREHWRRVRLAEMEKDIEQARPPFPKYEKPKRKSIVKKIIKFIKELLTP